MNPTNVCLEARVPIGSNDRSDDRLASDAMDPARANLIPHRPAESVFVVDEDAVFLDGIEDRYRDSYQLLTALSHTEAARLIDDDRSIAVVVIGVTSPSTRGLSLLRQVGTVNPSAAVILLADPSLAAAMQDKVEAATGALVLTKPVSHIELDSALTAGLDRVRRLRSADEHHRNILLGSLKSMLSILGLVCPRALEHAARVKRYAVGVGRLLGKPTSPQDHRCRPAHPGGYHVESDEIACAAVLSHLGCVALPPGLVGRALSGAELTECEMGLFQTHAVLGESIIRKVNRLEHVAQAVKYQMKNYDGTGSPFDDCAGEELPIAARVLRVVLDYDRLVTGGKRPQDALSVMRERDGRYDPKVLGALEVLLGRDEGFRPMSFEDAGRRDESGQSQPRRVRVLNRCDLTQIDRRVYRPVGDAVGAV